MIRISIDIPNSFTPERTYALKMLTRYFSNCEIEVTPLENIQDYVFQFGNGKQLAIRSSFWKTEENYLNEKMIPNQVDDKEVSLDKSFPLLSIYGNSTLKAEDSQIILNADIIASTFFMLTRWEETVIAARDEHGRFPDEEALAVKHGFYKRAIVNEYIELLGALITKLTGEKVEISNTYSCFLTHDVDEIFRLRPSLKFIKVLGADLLKRRSLSEFTNNMKHRKLSHKKPDADPSYTFDYLMDISEENNLKSHFYFIPGIPGESDFRYDIHDEKTKKLIQHIHRRGHHIGIHPSYNTFQNQKQFTTELERLKSVSGLKIEEGRHHYLRFSTPQTWRMWNDAGLKIDSTIGFHNHCGFRCGICYEFPVFDILDRKELALRERPLIVMEIALERYTQGANEFMHEILNFAPIIKKYKGNFVILWHNNNICHPYWREYGDNYREIISTII